MRWLVCGGRGFDDREVVFKGLDALAAIHRPSVLIHGGARGADTLAGEWAHERGVPVEVYAVAQSEWDAWMGLPMQERGRIPSPGSVRNRRMLEEGKPGLVVAFPGGLGTSHMVRIADRAGVTVLGAVVRDGQWKMVRLNAADVAPGRRPWGERPAIVRQLMRALGGKGEG